MEIEHCIQYGHSRLCTWSLNSSGSATKGLIRVSQARCRPGIMNCMPITQRMSHNEMDTSRYFQGRDSPEQGVNGAKLLTEDNGHAPVDPLLRQRRSRAFAEKHVPAGLTQPLSSGWHRRTCGRKFLRCATKQEAVFGGSEKHGIWDEVSLHNGISA